MQRPATTIGSMPSNSLPSDRSDESVLSSLFNPRVVLHRLPNNWNQLATAELKSQSWEPIFSESSLKNPKQQEILMNLEKNFPVLNSRTGQCVLCCKEQVETSLLKQVKPELVQSFNGVFNTPGTGAEAFDQDKFICCKSCTTELELLHYCSRQVQIVTRKFKSVREKLVKIMTRNYVAKNDKPTDNIAATATTRSHRIDQNNEDLDHFKLFESFECKDWRDNVALGPFVSEELHQETTTDIFSQAKKESKMIHGPKEEIQPKQIQDEFTDEEMVVPLPNICGPEEPLFDCQINEEINIKKEIADYEMEDVKMYEPDFNNQHQDFELDSFAFQTQSEEDNSSLMTINPSMFAVEPSRRISKEDQEIELRLRNGKFQCRFCGKEFLQKGGRKKHEKLYHLHDNKNTYHCHICGRISRGLAAFLKHLSKVHLKKGDLVYEDTFPFYSCDSANCTQCLGSQDLLKQHIEKSHRLFTCLVCNHVFAEEGHLESHIEKVHSEEKGEESQGQVKNYACEYCHLDFKLEKMLEYHKRIHLVKLDQQLNYKCHICQKGSATILALKRHKFSAHKIRQPKRQKLRKKRKEFILTDKIVKKAKSNAGRRPKKDYLFSCKVCDKQRLSAGQFKSHALLHEQNCGHHCKICTKVFLNYPALCRHVRFAHGTPKCRFCSKELRGIGFRRILEHEYKCNPQKYLDGKPYLCKLCMECFVVQEDLDSHQKQIHEPDKCKICNTQLLNKVGLQAHLKFHAIASAKNKGMQNLPLKTNKSSISCEECNITLQNGREFRYHKSVFHSIAVGERAFRKCKFGCEDKTFIKVTLQRKHYVDCHSEEYLKNGSVLYCGKCYKVFQSDLELTRHSKEHENEDLNLFQCETCGKQYKTKTNLDNHKFHHLPNHEGFCCEICGQIFKTPIPLTVHRKAHLDGKISNTIKHSLQTKTSKGKKGCEYGCESKTFPSFYLQRRHHVISHAPKHLKDNQTYCKTCFKVFQDEAKLEEHRLQHVPKIEHNNINMHCENGFTCEICGRTFEKSVSFKIHSKSHSRPHKSKSSYLKADCEHCGKNLSKGKTMNRHLFMEHKQEYLKDMPYHCKVCYAAFGTNEQVEEHLNSHCKCQFCGHLFLSTYKLKEHENTHTKNKPYQCKICGKCFSADPGLRGHMLIHSSVKPYNCELCSAGFMRKKFLVQHREKVHPISNTIISE